MKTTSCTTHRGIAIFWVLAFLFLARPYNKLQGKHYLYSSFSNPSDPVFLSTNHATQVVLGNDFVYETLTVDGLKLKYKQLEGGFTQPNAFISGKMLEWAKSACLFDDAASGDRTGGGVDPGSVVALPRPRRDDFLELYCGNGNFTVALSPLFRKVLATEISKVSVTACKENLAVNSVDNVHVVRLSSEELTKALDEGKQYNRLGEIDLTSFDLQTVLVDPPRAGMGPEVTKFVSRFSRIVYISCNPETLAEDIRALRETHVIARFAAFDQFPYTPHLECGALLVAKE
jgi:tRNA (uracil-5-)-methyltransferase